MRVAMRGFMAVALTYCMYGCTSMSQSGYSDSYRPLQAGPQTDLRYLPQACLADDMIGTVARLPPGCANALNLAEMVIDQRDLSRGREMGPALVGPAASAVEQYLGVREDQEANRRKQLESESTVTN